MATVSLASATYSGHPTSDTYSHKAYLVEKEINIATAVTSKGSALAASDILEVLSVPAKTLILAAGIEVVSAMTGTTADLTLDLGITGVDVDAFVDGMAWAAATAVGTSSTIPAATIGGKYLTTVADTIDLLLATQTGTLTGGKLRVWAVLVDTAKRNNPGIAAPGA